MQTDNYACRQAAQRPSNDLKDIDGPLSAKRIRGTEPEKHFTIKNNEHKKRVQLAVRARATLLPLGTLRPNGGVALAVAGKNSVSVQCEPTGGAGCLQKVPSL